jgi:CRP-like cAMP-binding protein
MALAPKLKEKRLGPEELIFGENQVDFKLYFLMGGNVEIFMNVNSKSKQSLTILKKNQIFGELAFFTGKATDHGAITTNVVSLVYLKLEDFKEIIQEFPDDNEKFAQMRDNFNLYKSTRGLGV